MRKSPGFALTVILTIALGIGANTAIFTLVHAVLMKSLPVVDPGKVSQGAFDAAVQVQLPAVLVTVTLPVPPSAEADCVDTGPLQAFRVSPPGPMSR